MKNKQKIEKIKEQQLQDRQNDRKDERTTNRTIKRKSDKSKQ